MFQDFEVMPHLAPLTPHF